MCLWLRYGLLLNRYPIIGVNVVGISLYSLYLLFYLWYSPRKGPTLVKMAIDVVLIAAILIGVHVFVDKEPEWTAQALGFVAMASQVVLYGAPLAAIVSYNRYSSNTSFSFGSTS